MKSKYYYAFSGVSAMFAFFAALVHHLGGTLLGVACVGIYWLIGEQRAYEEKNTEGNNNAK